MLLPKTRLKLLAWIAGVAVAFCLGILLGHSDRLSRTLPDAHYLDRVSLFKQFGGADIVMLGDSITEGADWARMFPGVSIANQGVSGDTTEGMLKRIELARAPKVFVMAGINDLVRGVPVDRVLENVRQMIAALAGSEVYLVSTLHVADTGMYRFKVSEAEINLRVDSLNDGLRAISQAHFVDLTDALPGRFAPDGLHLNGDGYAIWRSRIAPYVAR